MLKIKILKILPYWLIGLSVFLLLECGVLLFGVGLRASAAQSAQAGLDQPQVLGASTIASNNLRGNAPTQPQEAVETNSPDLSAVRAKSFLVFDLATGQPLLQKDAGEKLAIASLTKLMTGLVAYQTTNLNDSFTVTSDDTLNVSPSLGLKPGDNVKAQDIFNAMLVGSENDAALALSNYVATTTGQDFVSMMNSEAQTLGMADTSFANPLGFDSQANYSTALDLQKLIIATQKISAFTNLGRDTSYTFTGSDDKTYKAIATNTLLKTHPDISAIKTGNTAAAGQAMASKINFNGHDVVILVLDTYDRTGDTLKLKDILENNFSWE